MDESADKRVGTTLCNKWKLERLLGTGGMASVYVGVHKIGRKDAIKILHPDVARSPDLRARFEQEAHAANRFKHQGAVEIRDIDVAEDGAPFLVMELLEGESMQAMAARLAGEIPLTDLLRYVDELLDVLSAAHAQGIIHRDIKLDNLFVETTGHLKVLDFGIARIRDGARLFRTRSGATLGTASYMPPEQAQGAEVDARADLFSVGATMYRLLAKRRIHEGRTEADVLAKMATESAASLAIVAPSVPSDVSLVVDRALAFSRDRRYPDAATMQADIRALRDSKPPPYATKQRPIDDPLEVIALASMAAIAARARVIEIQDAPTVSQRDPASSYEPTRSERVPPPVSLAAAIASSPTSAASPAALTPPPQVSVSPLAMSPSPPRVSSSAPTTAGPSSLRHLVPAQTPPPALAMGPEITRASAAVSSDAPTVPRPQGIAVTPQAAPTPSLGGGGTVALPVMPLPDTTMRSENRGSISGAPPAPSIQVVSAPPLMQAPEAPPPRRSLVVPLVLVGGFFLLVGAGVVALLARGGHKQAETSPVTAATTLPSSTPIDQDPPKTKLTGALPKAPAPPSTPAAAPAHSAPPHGSASPLPKKGH
jgi:serine/threonine-protein kinase